MAKESAIGFDVLDLLEQHQDAHATCLKLADLICQKWACLGINQHTILRNLKDSVFLQVQLNAHAVKTRVRDHLRQRKFELEQPEHSYRQVINGTYTDTLYPCVLIWCRAPPQ
jgi:hypothetical protein